MFIEILNPKTTILKNQHDFFLVLKEKMIHGNYERILEKIANASGVDKSEVERRVEAKRAKLSGLISKEGAAQVIAAELGVSFDNEKLKIEELLPGMKKVNVVGKVINTFPVRSFVRNGKENKVANFIIADGTSNVKVVLWDTNHIDLIENGQVKEEVVIEIANASVRDGEIHLGSFSELKVSNESLGEVVKERVVAEKKIKDFRVSENVKTRAFVVQNFDLKFFNVCPECKKKPQQTEEGFKCNEHGSISPEQRALFNIVLDDGTETIRAVFFHDSLEQLGFDDITNQEKIAETRNNLLGKEMFFMGNVRRNAFFNNNELIVNGVEQVDVKNLITSLEKAK